MVNPRMQGVHLCEVVKEGLSIPLLLPCLLTHEVTPSLMGDTRGQAQVADGKLSCSLALHSITSRFCIRFGSVDELGAGGADGFFTFTGHWLEKVTVCLSPVSFGPASGTPRARCISHYTGEGITEGQSSFLGSVLFTCFEIPCVTGFVTMSLRSCVSRRRWSCACSSRTSSCITR